jgi:hypothetical protein
MRPNRLKRIKKWLGDRLSWRRRALLAEKTTKETLSECRNSIREYRKLMESGIGCVEAVMGRGIEWFDHEKLDYDRRLVYFHEARQILGNGTLQNELNHMRADFARFCLAEAQDFAAVRDMRMGINALEVLMGRLESVPDPRKAELDEEPFSPI